MARARNIKPAFFSNDELAENDPLGRLLFIGLWTLADYQGNVEWREKRIKAQLLPYDNADVKKLAINLDKSGFIRFYSDGVNNYLRVVNFSVHQNPHKNERLKGSDIPAYSESMRQAIDLQGLTINLDKSGLKRNDSASDRAESLILNPDSLILNPEPLTPKKKPWVSPAGLNLDAWAEFEQHRRDIKKPLTDTARTKAANQIIHLSTIEQQATVDKSISSRWAGLFPDNGPNKKASIHDISNQTYESGML